MFFWERNNVIKDMIKERRINLKIVYGVIIIGLNLYLIWLTLFKARIAFETNDDFGIAGIAGGLYGFRSPMVNFGNILYGYILMLLYYITNLVNWQIALYYIFVFMSSVMLELLLIRHENIPALSATVFVQLYFYHQVVQIINFTKISGYVTAMGYLLLFGITRYGKKTRYDKAAYLIGVLSIVYGSWLRFEVFMLISSFAFVTWFLLILFSKKDKSLIWKPYITVGILILASLIINKAAYSSDDWKEFYETGEYLGEIVDTRGPDFDSIVAEKGSTVGVPYSAYLTIIGWHFNDPDIINKDLCSRLASLKDKSFKPEKLKKFRLDLEDFLKLKEYALRPLLIAGILLLIKKDYRLYFLMISGILAAHLFYYSYLNRIVIRVIVTSAIGYAMAILAYLILRPISVKKAGMPILVGISAISLFACMPNVKEKTGYNFPLYEGTFFDDLAGLPENRRYVNGLNLHKSIYYEVGVRPYQPKEGTGLCNPIASWCCRLPIMAEKARRCGFHNPYGELLQEDVFFVNSEYYVIIKNFLREYYDASAVYSYMGEVHGLSIVKYQGNKEDLILQEKEYQVSLADADDDHNYYQLEDVEDAEEIWCEFLCSDTAEKHTYMATREFPGLNGLYCIIPSSDMTEYHYDKASLIYKAGGRYYKTQSISL